MGVGVVGGKMGERYKVYLMRWERRAPRCSLSHINQICSACQVIIISALKKYLLYLCNTTALFLYSFTAPGNRALPLP
jgi:hypothetical protein